VSEIIDRWRAGEGLPGSLTIDGHTHIMAWPYGVDHSTPEEGVAQAVAAMDANGVDAACVMSGGYMFAGLDYTVGNDVLLEMTRMAPGRLIGFGHINPNDTLERVQTELERIYDMGFRCLKLLNDYQDRYPGDGPNLMALYQFAAERNMLVFNHMWLPDELPRIAREFPSVDLISGHYLGPDHEPLLRDFPNVYTNLASIHSLGFLERAVRNVGPHKYLMGSDGFMVALSRGIGPVVYADIPDEDKRQILGETQARLLDKVGALPQALKTKLEAAS
jgi:predicted TIM-barrel fold metal-dependent hydrolase